MGLKMREVPDENSNSIKSRLEVTAPLTESRKAEKEGISE